MSIPWWNETKLGPSKPPASTPFRKTVRGSPKKPRIGCCWLNGLIGHEYADALAAQTSASETDATAIRTRPFTTGFRHDGTRTGRRGWSSESRVRDRRARAGRVGRDGACRRQSRCDLRKPRRVRRVHAGRAPSAASHPRRLGRRAPRRAGRPHLRGRRAPPRAAPARPRPAPAEAHRFGRVRGTTHGSAPARGYGRTRSSRRRREPYRLAALRRPVPHHLRRRGGERALRVLSWSLEPGEP